MAAREQIENLLQTWARRTREGDQDQILAHHAADAVIFDVLPPRELG